VTVYSLLVPGGGFSAGAWAGFWHTWLWINLVIGIPITAWTVIGGWSDIRQCIKRLNTLERDDRDDGRVIDHHLADEVEKPKAVEGHTDIWPIQPEGSRC
jgi:hypothetical protein